MASQWYIKSDDAEVGPISFPALVELARSEEITESDLVRPDWKTEWQRADSVIGLYYMARKAPEPAAPIETPEVVAPPAPVLEEEAAAKPDSLPQHPPWLQRMLQFIRTPIPSTITRTAATESAEPTTADPAIDPDVPAIPVEVVNELATELAPAAVEATSAEWSNTLQAALDYTDARAPTAPGRNSSGRLAAFFGRLGSSRLGIALRLVIAIACAALVAQEVERISKRETLISQRRAFLFDRHAAVGFRHPTPPPPADQRHFPIVGLCDSSVYYGLLLGLAVGTAVGVYGGGKLLGWSLSGWPDSRSRSIA